MAAEVDLNRLFDVMSEDLQHARTTDEATRFAVDRMVARMRKRARLSQKGLSEKAIANFCDTNSLVAGYDINSLPRRIIEDARHFITVVLERFNSRVDSGNIQVSFDLWYMLDQWRFGPGASNGVSGTHTAQKIEQPMTCTESCVPLVVKLRSNNPYFASFDSIRKQDGYSVVQGSRLTTVPKNQETERTIAIEPSGNMALQLAAGEYLEDVLRSIGLDISKQQKRNKLLAFRGSWTGRLATIDLKSASDMISPKLVRALMPEVWYNLLMAIRSPFTELPDGRTVKLEMISTMGNGYTFPLMTLLIVALIYGYRAQHDGPSLFVDWSETAVYGDDIIIPSYEYEGFCEVLRQAGLVVNHDKSYSSGPFRESCGGDYFNGVDVTPVYIKSIRTDSEVYTAINQLLEWGARTKILLARSLALLKSQLRTGPYLVPEWENPDSGILTSGCGRRYKYLSPEQQHVRLKTSHFAYPLAVGGYIVGRQGDAFFLPRPFKTRYRVTKGRLPRGFLSGRDPIKRTAACSSWIESYVALLFSPEIESSELVAQ